MLLAVINWSSRRIDVKFLHYPISASQGDVVEVTLSSQANVRLMDGVNFAHYRRGQRHTFHGGLVKVSPARFPVPHGGSWHVVVDLGGYAGSVRAGVRVIS
jgi:hypothetical protein